MDQEKQEIQEQPNRKERLIVIIILILIVIFVIVFLLIHYMGIIEHKPKIPTGNVDIFEIIFGGALGDCNYRCVCGKTNGETVGCEYCKNNSINCGNNCSNANNNNNNGNNNDNDEGTGNRVVVYDSDTEYSSNTPLNIFTQTAYYVVEDKIAPTSENSYIFVIRNSNNFNIKYNLKAIETNIYNINMKYRLKLNGDYVLGDNNEYVTSDELQQYNIGLANNTYDVYTLDWKWFESSNDTEVGEDISSFYRLDLQVTAYQD